MQCGSHATLDVGSILTYIHTYLLTYLPEENGWALGLGLGLGLVGCWMWDVLYLGTVSDTPPTTVRVGVLWHANVQVWPCEAGTSPDLAASVLVALGSTACIRGAYCAVPNYID